MKNDGRAEETGGVAEADGCTAGSTVDIRCGESVCQHIEPDVGPLGRYSKQRDGARGQGEIQAKGRNLRGLDGWGDVPHEI